MLDVCLLGTGGMMPLPRRKLTALMTRYNGSNLMIDCGEGTQVAVKEKGWSFKPIDVICFTHYHADHISEGSMLVRITLVSSPSGYWSTTDFFISSLKRSFS